MADVLHLIFTIIGVVIFIGIAVPGMLFSLIVPFALYYRIRRRGYTPFFTFLVYIILLISLVIIQTIITLPWLSDTTDNSNFIGKGILYTTINTSVNYLSVVIVRFLPKIRTKSHATLKIPFLRWIVSDKFLMYFELLIKYYKLRLIGIMFFISCIFTALLDNNPRGSIPNFILGNVYPMILFGVIVFVLVRVLKQKLKIRLEARKNDLLFDTRSMPFVLYLRSFNVEVDIFSISRISNIDAREMSRTFDQYFAATVKEEIGPLVALGSPIDHWLDSFMWRNTEGAKREYINGENWKENLAPKLDNCVAIFLHAGVTENVDYELTEIINKKYASKLFIMTKPPMEGRYRKITVPLGNWIKGTPHVEWKSFVELLRKCGYQLPNDNPEPGSIFTFDSSNKAILLHSGLKYPKDYIFYVKYWLANAGY